MYKEAIPNNTNNIPASICMSLGKYVNIYLFRTSPVF